MNRKQKPQHRQDKTKKNRRVFSNTQREGNSNRELKRFKEGVAYGEA